MSLQGFLTLTRKGERKVMMKKLGMRQKLDFETVVVVSVADVLSENQLDTRFGERGKEMDDSLTEERERES